LIEKWLLGIELGYRGERGAGKVAGEQEKMNTWCDCSRVTNFSGTFRMESSRFIFIDRFIDEQILVLESH
jgi:hypothetical protein